MKILFIGHELIGQRFQRTLEKEDIRIVSNTDLPSVLRLLEQNKFDLVILDSTMQGAGDISRAIYDLATVPVVLMVDQAEKSWKSILTFDADAFITEHASNPEMLARIKAIYRRSKKAQRIVA